MRRPRWLERCAPTVLAFVVVTSVFPRPAALVHHHADGGRAHVHTWGIGTIRPGGGSKHGGVTRPRAAVVDHVHWQLPFQVAARAATLTLRQIIAALPVVGEPFLASGHTAALSTAARAPPA